MNGYGDMIRWIRIRIGRDGDFDLIGNTYHGDLNITGKCPPQSHNLVKRIRQNIALSGGTLGHPYCLKYLMNRAERVICGTPTLNEIHVIWRRLRIVTQSVREKLGRRT